MTQRLALHHILTTQLAKNWENEEKAKARLAQMSGRRDKERASLRSANVPARYHAMMPETSKTYDSMVENIHQTMQSVRPKRKPVPRVSLPDTAVPALSPEEAPPLKSTLVSKHSKRNRSNRVKGGANGHGSATRSSLKPLALIRAGLNLKTQRATSGGEVKIPKGFIIQKQMQEVVRQKNVLESMLLQHKRLRADRMTIVLDMQRMRADLDRICNKLDNSLQTLNSTRTLCSAAPSAKPKKGAVQKKSLHNMGASSSHRRSGGTRKARSNTIPMNRQSTVANKPRNGVIQKKSPSFVATNRRRSTSGMHKAKINSILVNQRLRSN